MQPLEGLADFRFYYGGGHLSPRISRDGKLFHLRKQVTVTDIEWKLYVTGWTKVGRIYAVIFRSTSFGLC